MAISPAILFNWDLRQNIYVFQKYSSMLYWITEHWGFTLRFYIRYLLYSGQLLFHFFAREALQYSYQIENVWLFLDTQKLWDRSPAYQKAVPGHLRVRYLPQDVIRSIGSYKLTGINIQIFACYQTPEQLETRVFGEGGGLGTELKSWTCNLGRRSWKRPNLHKLPKIVNLHNFFLTRSFIY